MRKASTIVQIACTYIGTIVGAGFATGQEILQFFTRYGWMASLTIGLASLLFIWLGTKLMLIAHDVGASSYEDLNKYLFGDRIGRWISLFTLVILFGITAVMLAGAGSVFEENFNLSYQFGLLFTLALAYLIIIKGIHAILAVNAIVVPVMFAFTFVIVMSVSHIPTAGNWLSLESAQPLWRVWMSPFLYVAFNLALAQAVLVPLGSAMKDRSALVWGACLGGVGIGVMLLAGHYALSANMPGIARFEIPMSHIIYRLGEGIQLAFVVLIFCEIFTTLIADVYGLSLQIRQRLPMNEKLLVLLILLLCYLISQVGFSTLLSFLYPLFGMISMVWFCMMVWRNRTA